MAALDLTRAPGDRRLYELQGVGSLRLEGFASRRASAEAGGRSWRFARLGILRQSVLATDAAGTSVGEFLPRGLRRGGSVRWAGRAYALRAASAFRERYALVEADRELAILDGKGWGKRPVTVHVADDASVEPGLLLFATFVVRGLAEDASAAAGAAAGTAV